MALSNVRLEYFNHTKYTTLIEKPHFVVFAQVGEEDQEKPESSVEKQKKSNSKPETVVDLEKVVIKKRERKDERKSSDGKDFVIKKPSGLIAKLAKKKKDMPAVPTEVPDMTDQEKSEIRKKCRAKVLHFIVQQLYQTNDTILFSMQRRIRSLKK